MGRRKHVLKRKRKKMKCFICNKKTTISISCDSCCKWVCFDCSTKIDSENIFCTTCVNEMEEKNEKYILKKSLTNYI